MSSLMDKLFFRGKHVCPSWLCFIFDNPLRKMFQNPYNILSPYIRPGQTVVDIGSGKGYFTIPMCKLTGREGKVIAADIQERMLRDLQRRAFKAGLAANLTANLCKPDDFCLDVKADFILAFWMVHEVPERLHFFMNVKEIPVTNAANLAFFMVDFSYALLQPLRDQNPDYSILDLKSNYRGRRYVSEIKKCFRKNLTVFY